MNINEDNKNNILNYPLTASFFAFIAVIFVLYFVIPDKELSEWENRYLAKAPELNVSDIADGTYMTKYEDYINDQMPFRDELIKLKACAETAFLKVENNGIAKGKNSYLFTKQKNDTSVFDKNIGIISQFCESVNNPVKVAIAPNACGVITDSVPTGFMMVDQEAKLKKLSTDNSLLKGASVVDLRCALKAHEDEYIYYRTDHHWTTLGAYYAYCEISDNPVDLKTVQNDCEQADCAGFFGTLYAKYKGLFVLPDVITYYDIPVKEYTTDDKLKDSLLDKDKLTVFDKYGMFMHGNFSECHIKTFTENGKSLVIFKDSYANCLIPFMTYDYEDITVVDLRYFGGSVSELISEKKDADVLFINNFDFLNEDNHFYKLMK